MRWQPAFRVLVVERPGRHNDEEGDGGAGEANIEGEADILLYVADDEGQDLKQSVSLTTN